MPGGARAVIRRDLLLMQAQHCHRHPYGPHPSYIMCVRGLPEPSHKGKTSRLKSSLHFFSGRHLHGDTLCKFSKHSRQAENT